VQLAPEQLQPQPVRASIAVLAFSASAAMPAAEPSASDASSIASSASTDATHAVPRNGNARVISRADASFKDERIFASRHDSAGHQKIRREPGCRLVWMYGDR
jgi:hypothetical protein